MTHDYQFEQLRDNLVFLVYNLQLTHITSNFLMIAVVAIIMIVMVVVVVLVVLLNRTGQDRTGPYLIFVTGATGGARVNFFWLV